MEIKRYSGNVNVYLDGKLVATWMGISGNARQRRLAIRALKKIGYGPVVCNGKVISDSNAEVTGAGTASD